MGPRLEPSKRTKQESRGNVAAAYLALLADRGVDYLFGNAGTDFAPMIEAYSQAAQTGVAVPQPILATHENLAVTMAHGYGMISRRIPAVMVQCSDGTARARLPVLAARGHCGARCPAGRPVALAASPRGACGAGCSRHCRGGTLARPGRASAHRDGERGTGHGSFRRADALRRAFCH